MTTPNLEPEHGGGRYPGFDTLRFRDHWDDATLAAVESRLGMPPDLRFFTLQEQATATALFDQLLYQRGEPKVPVTNMVDARLAELETDGWHYDSMPGDAEAWRVTLAALDHDASAAHGSPFCELGWDEQTALLTSIHDTDGDWHGFRADRVWSLWTRYACTAFYSHPLAWNEIGFAGPAYPRGYKNLGVDRLEPFEVLDARPSENPIPGRRRG